MSTAISIKHRILATFNNNVNQLSVLPRKEKKKGIAYVVEKKHTINEVSYFRPEVNANNSSRQIK
jgi:hypothetical protein